MDLTVEDYLDAVAMTVKQLGGFKTVGALMRPEMDAQAAGRWLSDCCNPREREVLHPQQLALIRRMARQQDVHTLAEFEMRDAGYSAPVPAVQVDEKERLQREFIKAAQQQAQIMAQLQALMGDVE